MNKIEEENITKRIIKCYLSFKKEATARMITKHIETTGYGLRKPHDPIGLSMKIKVWARDSSSWFNVGHYKNKEGISVFYLKE